MVSSSASMETVRDAVEGTPVVYVVDDDDDMRDSLEHTLRDEGFRVELFAAPGEFLAAFQPERPGCIVVDLRLPEMSGIQMCEQVIRETRSIPFIVITGHGAVPEAVTAMKLGAIDFLEKPFRARQLLERVRDAIGRDLAACRAEAVRVGVRNLADALTPREREVMGLLVSGQSTKRIASMLGISVKTAHIHRAKVFEKMQVDNLAKLVQLLHMIETP